MKVKAAEGRPDLVDAGDDLIRIVTKVTSDLERFDALLLRHRKMLEHPTADESDMLTRQSERLSQEAANMVTSVQEALKQLRELSQATKPKSRG
ncbi:MAG TPA: hypothetical protein VNO87_11060 [Methylomirabilota bacterium]|nr:hypothetical protein [Methylomirabilota bacterium]